MAPQHFKRRLLLAATHHASVPVVLAPRSTGGVRIHEKLPPPWPRPHEPAPRGFKAAPALARTSQEAAKSPPSPQDGTSMAMPPAMEAAEPETDAVGLTELLLAVRTEFSRCSGASAVSSASAERLPEEVEEGNVEYKLQLLDPAPERLRQLTTQMHWRLNEGSGTAFYEVGVRDNGESVGLSEDALCRSLATLARMCHVVHARLSLSRFRHGRDPQRKAARVRVTRVLEASSTKRLRVSVIGAFESGKSTLVGVLTRGCLDDGAGLARMQVCRHRHELENGRTSSVSEHTIAVASDGRFRCTDELGVCNFGEDAEEEDGDTESFLTLSDLAGHQKYLKSTASALAGQFPDYAMLVVDAAVGVQAMTREHVKIAAALEVAIFVVLTKTDLTSLERIQQTIVDVSELLQGFCPAQRLVLASGGADLATRAVIPAFQVSNVTGSGLDVLQSYLAELEPTRVWSARANTPAEFQITQAYDLEGTGTVVTGLVQSGTLSVGQKLLLGPDNRGQFCDVAVASIEVQHKAAQRLSAGETGAILVRFLGSDRESGDAAQQIRKGAMLVHPSVHPLATRQFDAELHFLPDARAFRENFQGVIHAGHVRQMAKLVRISDAQSALPSPTPSPSLSPSSLRAATTLCRFEFMYWPEYVRPDLPLVLREGSAQAVGRVVGAVLPHFHGKQRATRVPSC